MGEAKRRGTAEERKAQAVKREADKPKETRKKLLASPYLGALAVAAAIRALRGGG
jgi:hypothetical protein